MSKQQGTPRNSDGTFSRRKPSDAEPGPWRAGHPEAYRRRMHPQARTPQFYPTPQSRPNLQSIGTRVENVKSKLTDLGERMTASRHVLDAAELIDKTT